jgi:hypothetical protein
MGSKGGRDGGNSNLRATSQSKGFCVRYWPWLAVAAIILVTACLRVRSLSVPLERDEGEYAYAGQLILQGVAPYDQAYNMKMPGIYVAYAGIMAIFGQSCAGIHLGLLIVNAATILLVFLLTRCVDSPLAGVFAAAAFAVLSLSLSVLGVFAHAEHFVILFALAGLLLLIRAVDRKSIALVLAGSVLLGIGFMMKQHGVGFILFGGLYILLSELHRRPLQLKSLLLKTGAFLVGVLLPFGATCLILFRAGVFRRFWFWTFTYARQYVSIVPLREGWELLTSEATDIAGSAAAIWILAGIGLVALFVNGRLRKKSAFVVGFLLCSFLCICPGLFFRNHYFVLLLPAIALLSGIGMAGFQQVVVRPKANVAMSLIPAILGLAAMSWALYQQKDLLSATNLDALSREVYSDNPFPESLKIAEYINAHSTASDTVAILGSEPQIYFYSHRRSATGYIYAYPLMEPHPYALKMQQEMIQQIETAKPKFLIFVDISTSWLAGPMSNTLIRDWFQKNQDKYYKLVGAIDIVSTDKTLYTWNEKGFDYEPKSDSWIAVLERKDAGSP